MNKNIFDNLPPLVPVERSTVKQDGADRNSILSNIAIGNLNQNTMFGSVISNQNAMAYENTNGFKFKLDILKRATFDYPDLLK